MLLGPRARISSYGGP